MRPTAQAWPVFPIVWMEGKICLAGGQKGGGQTDDRIGSGLRRRGAGLRVSGWGARGSRHISPHRPLLCPWDSLSVP